MDTETTRSKKIKKIKGSMILIMKFKSILSKKSKTFKLIKMKALRFLMMIRLCRVRKWIHNTIIPTILIHQINLMDRLNPQLTLFMKILQMKLRIIYTLTALRRPFIRLEAVSKMIRCITLTKAGSSKSLTTFTFALLNPKHPKFPQNLSHKNTTMIVKVTKRTTRVTTK